MFEEKMKKVIDDPHRDENHGGPKDKHDHHHGPHPDRHPEHEKKVVIYVNGRPFEWKKPTISFEEVITLAFGSFNPAPHIAYTVSYFDGPMDFREGKLTKGHSIPVKDGEKINADRTDRS